MSTLRRRMMMLDEEGELPAGYTKCNYIGNTGDGYIDTEVRPSDSICVECKFTNNNPNITSTIFGCDFSGTYYKIHCDGNLFRYSYNKARSKSIGIKVDTLSHTVIMNRDSNIYFDDKIVVSSLPKGFNVKSNLALFARASGSWYDSYFIGNIFYCKIWDGDKLIRDFVPAKEDSSGDYGMYDTVEKKFYKSPNGNKFIGK